MKYKKAIKNIFNNISLSKILTIIVISLPIINQYKIAPLQIMDLLAICGIFLVFIKSKIINFNKILILYLLYIVFDLFCMTLSLENISLIGLFARICRIIVVYLFYYVITFSLFCRPTGYNYYTFLVMVVSWIIVLQTFTYYFLGFELDLLIPGMELNYMGLNSDELMKVWHNNAQLGYYRPCSLFLEPAHHSQFVLPWLAMNLISKNSINFNRKKICQVAIVSFSLINTTSSLGIIGLFLIMFLFSIRQIFIFRKLKYLVVLLPFIFLMLIVVCKNPNTLTQLSMKSTSVLQIKEGTSTSLRLIRGPLVYWNLDVINRILGCGYGNIKNYMLENNMHILDDGISERAYAYMNGLFYLINCTGLVGFMFYVIYIYDLFCHSRGDYGEIGLLVVLILFSLTTELFDAPVLFIILAFLYCSKYSYDN